MRRHRLAFVSTVFLAILLVLSVAAPWIAEWRGIDPTMTDLLQRFGDLETVLGSVDEISGAKRKENLTNHADDARVSKQLATILRDVPVDIDPAHEAARAVRTLGDRVVVKPCSNGSAIGVARFDAGGTPAAIAGAIEAVWAIDDVALVERFAEGREITCGVLDLPGAPSLSPTEIRSPRDAFFTYEARYAPGRSEHICPAPLGDALTRRVQEIAIAAHRALGDGVEDRSHLPLTPQAREVEVHADHADRLLVDQQLGHHRSARAEAHTMPRRSTASSRRQDTANHTFQSRHDVESDIVEEEAVAD